jgi:hypothetical protein
MWTDEGDFFDQAWGDGFRLWRVDRRAVETLNAHRTIRSATGWKNRISP